MVNITPIVEAFLTLIAAVIAVVVVPYIKSRTTAQQQAELAIWVKIAVSAAEQLFRESGAGATKKAYVVNWLNEHGITVDENKIDAMIESAVYELKIAANTATAIPVAGLDFETRGN